jgi:NADPH:quinone reductase-like Zn-dependent oxidoreductase
VRIATSPSADVPLAIVTHPSRALRAGELRVKVRAIGVNPVDWKMRSGGPLRFAHRFVGPGGPLVVGVDFSGEVVEVGPGVDTPSVGARVVGGTNFARKQLGSYADQVIVRPDQVAELPESVSFEEAASIPVPAVTAWRALTEIGEIDRKKARGKEPRVLVLGASGGVGIAAIQLARTLGAKAIGVCSGRNVAFVEGLGATAIDYTKGDALDAARAHGPFDLVLHAVGTATYPLARCRALLAEGGRVGLVVVRPADWLSLLFRPSVRAVLGKPTRTLLEPLVAAASREELAIPVEARFSLEEAEAAHVRSKAGKVVGKLLILPILTFLTFMTLLAVPGCKRAAPEHAAEAAASASSGAPSVATSAPLVPNAPPPGLVAHREAGRWKSAEGVDWRALVVPTSATHDDLVKLARWLRVESPSTFFDLYDDDAQIPALVAAAGNDDALPEAWRDAHAVATIAGTVGGTPQAPEVYDLQLFEWRTMQTTKLP